MPGQVGGRRLARETLRQEIQRTTAQQKSQELEQQLRISAVTRLAAQSQAIAEDLPVQSVLLAIEAVESTRRHDTTIMPVAHETLLSTTANIGGLPLIGHEEGMI